MDFKSEIRAKDKIVESFNAQQRIFHLVTDSFEQVVRLMRKANLGGNGVEAMFIPLIVNVIKVNCPNKGGSECPAEQPQNGKFLVYYAFPAGIDTFFTENAERTILDFAQKNSLHTGNTCCIVLFGKLLTVSPMLSYYVKRIEIDLPDKDEIITIIRSDHPHADQTLCARYAQHLHGLDIDTIRLLIRGIKIAAGPDLDFETGRKKIIAHKQLALRKHNKLLLDDIPELPENTDVRTWLNQNRMLPYGMDNIIQWLIDHAESIREVSDKSSVTKGMLLLGVPGTGKSMLCKACASILGVPMVRLDIGNILGSHVGESEHNMDEVLNDLTFLAPCVLFVDEIEKALSGGQNKNESGDSGVMRRLMGKLLSFMSDSKKTVFMIATANDISSLPPEFIRNGRFDAKYCILMPQYSSCKAIIGQLLRGHGIPFVEHDNEADKRRAERELMQVCAKTDSGKFRFFTGADLEALVKEMFNYYKAPDNSNVPNDVIKNLKAAMKIALNNIVTPGEHRPASIRELAGFYLDILQKDLLVACELDTDGNGEPLFSAERFDVRAFKKNPNGSCITAPPALLEHQRRAHNDDGLEYDYNKHLYDAIEREMNAILKDGM